MNNEVLVNIYSDDLTDAETESLFSTPKDSKKENEERLTTKRRNEKHGLTLRGHVMACHCMTICTSIVKIKSIVLASYAVGKIALVDMLLPSRK